MKILSYDETGALTLDGHNLDALAHEHGTPTYVYSAPRIVENYRRIKKAITAKMPDQKHIFCYAVKANSHIAVLKLLARENAGADVVSKGELMRCLKAGIPADKIVFSGVGKTENEIAYAIEKGILQINAESLTELERIDKVASRLNKRARVGLRINPDVAGGEHDKTSTGRKDDKFGIGYDYGIESYLNAKRFTHIDITGMSVHIGSQIVDIAPFDRAYQKIAAFVKNLEKAGITLKTIDLGGGMGINYTDEKPLDMQAYAETVARHFSKFNATLVYEPGRYITGDAGILLAKVEYVKETPSGRTFVILDTGMGELLRPALYGVTHPVLPCKKHDLDDRPAAIYDVVGPICESSDIFSRNVSGQIMHQGDTVAITVSGAYGMSMASKYNTRALPLEIMTSPRHINVISPRQTLEDILSHETIPEWIENNSSDDERT